jgi:hypothetical protein
MKFFTILLLLIGIAMFNSCKKEAVVVASILAEEEVVADTTAEEADTVWVYYDETYCADSWGVCNVVEQEKIINIENYFNDLNVEIFEIEISEENAPDDNFGCGNKSGYVIKCKIQEEDISILIGENFYN